MWRGGGAVYLTRFARKVTVIHRRDRLRAARSIQERAFANPKVAFLWDSVVVRAEGTDVLEAITVKNVKTGALSTLRADPADGMLGLFGFTGYPPNTGLFTGQLALEEGYISTGEDMSAGLPGVFAAGDCTGRPYQYAKAVGEGNVALHSAVEYIKKAVV